MRTFFRVVSLGLSDVTAMAFSSSKLFEDDDDDLSGSSRYVSCVEALTVALKVHETWCHVFATCYCFLTLSLLYLLGIV